MATFFCIGKEKKMYHCFWLTFGQLLDLSVSGQCTMERNILDVILQYIIACF